MMTQKTISLNDKAYKLLRKQKKDKESYSDTIIRLCQVGEQSEDEDFLLKYIGVFQHDDAHWDDVEEKIQKHRSDHLSTEDA